jgi:hypothetical protein
MLHMTRADDRIGKLELGGSMTRQVRGGREWPRSTCLLTALP